MRKYLISVNLLLSFCFFGNAQTWADDMVIARKMVDSFKNELNYAKGDKRIDYLNLLADTYFWIWDDNDKHLDSVWLYASEAHALAKKSGYKKGLGYSLLGKASCLGGKVDENKNNNNSEANYAEAEIYAQQAIKIGEEIKDYRLVADVYDMLKWMERWKGSPVKFKDYVGKAILYYEKPVTKKLTGIRNISKCDQCQGNEGHLAGLYQLLAMIALGEDNTPLAKQSMEKVVHYSTMLGKKAALGNIYMQFAETVTQTVDLEAGIIPYKKAVAQFQESGDAKGEFDAHIRICRNYWNLGDFENGFIYCKKGIALAKELSNGRPEKENDYRWGEAYYWMSRYYLIAGDFESALSYIKKTEPFYQTEFQKMVWATAIGGVYRSMGNIDSAKYYLLPLGIKPPGSLGQHVGNIEPSRLYIHLKEYDKAIAALNQLIERDREKNNYIALGGDLTVLSKAYLGKNENVAALNAAREGLAAIKRSKRSALLIEHYETLSTIFYKLGNSDSAYIYIKLHMALKDSLLKKQYLFRLNNYKSEAEDAKRTSQIMLLEKDYLIKEQELLQQIILKQQSEAQLALSDKSNEIKDQQLHIKDQSLKEQILLKEQKQSQLTLSDKENKLKDQRLKQQAFIRNALLGGLLLLILLGVFVFRNLSLKRKNEKLAIKKEQAELQQKVAELEMQALRAQMNPHFIFNCLSSINRFIFKNDNKIASDYLTRFSRLIRMVLMHSQKKLIPLEDELEMIRLYLDLERLRFKDAFDYSITTTNIVDAGSIFIPPLLLQPFCENAVWHGLMHKETKGHLNVIISEVVNENDKTLRCVIEDNGVGRDKAAEMNSKSAGKEKSLGLKITTERIALLNKENNFNTFYKIDDILNDEHEVAGTRVQLKIKYKETVEEIV